MRTKVEADKAAIQAFIKNHGGEVPLGVDLVRGEDAFKVKF